MSISAINAAVSAELGKDGTLVGSTMHYIDGGRIQLIAATVIDPAGNRQSLIRHFVGFISVADEARAMVQAWKAGELPVVVTDGPAAGVQAVGAASFVPAPSSPLALARP